MRFNFSLFAVLLLAISAQARIIQNDDLVFSNNGALNMPPVVRQAVDNIGLISMGCTGTHIGSNLVITAAHCFVTFNAPLTYNVACPDVTIQWGVRGDRRGLVSRCLRIVGLEMTKTKDWAVFQVDRAPYSYSEVELQSRVSPQTHLTILSHPQTKPLAWSRVCRALPFVSNSYAPATFHHQCDTEPGSSGAPIFEARSMKIVGIHNGGYASPNNQGTYNYATYVTDIPWQLIIAKAKVRNGRLLPTPGSTGGF